MPKITDEIVWTDEAGKVAKRGMTSDYIVDLRIESIKLATSALPERMKSPKGVLTTAGHIYEYLLTGNVNVIDKSGNRNGNGDGDGEHGPDFDKHNSIVERVAGQVSEMRSDD